MQKTDIILSSATIASAISALGQIGMSGESITVRKNENSYTEAVNNAISGSQAQRNIRSHIPTITNVVVVDNELLSSAYFEVAQVNCLFNPVAPGCPPIEGAPDDGEGEDDNYEDDEDYIPPNDDSGVNIGPSPISGSDNRRFVGPLLSDSTIDSPGGAGNFQADHFGCYTNCHSACHGSRGWR